MNPDLANDIKAGRHAKVRPLAEAMNMAPQTLYDAVDRKEVASVKVGKSIRIPAREAARLLGIEEAQPVAA